jgi:hypothetical protein
MAFVKLVLRVNEKAIANSLHTKINRRNRKTPLWQIGECLSITESLRAR